MRATLIFWECLDCKHINRVRFDRCEKCSGRRVPVHAQVRESQRAVVYTNPLTGERRTPPRADQPIPEIYARQGFERTEIFDMSAYEKATGVVHESTNFSPGNEPSPWKEPERRPTPPEVTQALVDDLRSAIASGPFTESESSPDRFTIANPI